MVSDAAESVARMSRLVRTNVSALINRADDPEAAFDRLLAEFTENIDEAEQAIAQTVGGLRLLEDDLREARADESEWGDRANAALRKAGPLRAQGQAAEADRSDELARLAFRRQAGLARSATTMAQQVTEQSQLSDQLRVGLDRLRMKREVLLRSRAELAGRSGAAEAHGRRRR